MLNSLRSRFYLIVIGIATVPILILGLTAGERSAAEFEHQSILFQNEVAKRIEREITSFVEMRLQELRVFERTSPLVAMDDTELTAILSRMLAYDRSYQALLVVGRDGRIRGGVSRTKIGLSGTKFENGLRITQPAFWDDRKQHVGAVEYDEELREPLLGISVPIIERRSGKVTRVLHASIRFKRIWDLLADLGLPGGADAFVVDEKGRFLAHRYPAMVLSRNIFQLPEKDGRYLLENGQPGLVVKQTLSLVGEPAYVVVTRPLASALRIAFDMRAATLWTCLLLLVVAGLLALLMSRQILGPIDALVAVSRRISSGSTDADIPVSGPSEIHALGHALQHMTGRLRAIIGELERSEFVEHARAMVTLESIGDAVITTDAQGRVNYLNPVAIRMTGWPLNSARGLRVEEIFHIVNEETRAVAPDPIARCLVEGRIVGLANHTVLLSRSGHEYAIQDSAAPIRDDEGTLIGVVMVFSDVTAARELQLEISHQAVHDSLTGLLNRREFERRLARVLKTARNDSSEHALCYLDLDQFKVINDTSGHTAGDELLCQITMLFEQKIRHRDTLARLGGDEFAVLMEHCSQEQALRVAEALRSGVEDLRFSWENKAFTVGVSIGLVHISQYSGNANTVLRAADNACYVAKDTGRNRVHIYREDDTDLAKRRDEMHWVAILNRALEEGRFELYAQRIVDINPIDQTTTDSGVEHFELLLRLIDAGGELILPGIFLPAAERYSLISRIDRWVLGRALDWLANHLKDASRVICSINISGASVGEESFLNYVLERLDESGVAGEQVYFEITETAAISNLSMATRFIHALRQRGCGFALDDFGGGLSSFAYLKTLPVQCLKIDGIFVKDIADDPLDLAMVRSINEVGQLLDMRTIAEFVETPEVLNKLIELGVNAVQGQHISPPEPLIALERRLNGVP